MFRTILAAIDLSSQAEAVFAAALEMARLNSGRLLLLHVLSGEDLSEEETPDLPYLPYMADPETFRFYQAQWQHYAQAGMLKLEALAEQARQTGVTCQLLQRPGSTGPAICTAASEQHADLIVCGRRGRTGLSEFFLGSVSNYVLHHATCTVLVVHPSPVPASSAPQATTGVAS